MCNNLSFCGIKKIREQKQIKLSVTVSICYSLETPADNDDMCFLMVNHCWKPVVIMKVYIEYLSTVKNICITLILFVLLLLTLRNYFIIESHEFDSNANLELEPIVRNLCQGKINKYLQKRPVGRYSIQPHTGLLLCRTAKHGSSSLASIFLKIYERYIQC